MNCNTLLYTKAELLCYGIRVYDDRTRAKMLQKNAYVFDSGFMHAAHFLIDDLVINTCVSESFCGNSPYTIKASDDKFELLKNNNFVCYIEVLELPEWCNDYVGRYKIGDYLRPHSKECIACWPYLKCNYYLHDMNCKFCSMGKYHLHDIIEENVVAEMMEKALYYNPEYEIALSGGTCGAPDHTIKYFSNICNRVKNIASFISVEIAPPDDLNYISELKNSGVTAIIMNLEIVNDILRKEICPGKAKISKQHYIDAFKKAVDVFGVGNVSSVLLAGIQDSVEIKHMCDEMISLGVVPTIIPFKPLDGCDMSAYPCTKPLELIDISKTVDRLMSIKGLDAGNQQGCTKCNGCSLETIASKI